MSFFYLCICARGEIARALPLPTSFVYQVHRHLTQAEGSPTSAHPYVRVRVTGYSFR